MIDVSAFDGFIFDMDGTLLDSMPMWENLAPDYFQRHGVAYTEDVLSEIAATSLRQAADILAVKYFPTYQPEDMFNEWEAYLQEQYAHKVQLKPGVQEFLEGLQKLGKKMCIATMTDRQHAELAVKAHGIAQYFSFIKTVGEVGKTKSFPDIYLQAAAELGVAPEQCLVFEDSCPACITARSAGFMVCGVADTNWSCNEAEMRVICNAFINNFNELKIR